MYIVGGAQFIKTPLGACTAIPAVRVLYFDPLQFPLLSFYGTAHKAFPWISLPKIFCINQLETKLPIKCCLRVGFCKLLVQLQ
jgi:hypothetical protein